MDEYAYVNRLTHKQFFISLTYNWLSQTDSNICTVFCLLLANPVVTQGATGGACRVSSLLHDQL